MLSLDRTQRLHQMHQRAPSTDDSVARWRSSERADPWSGQASPHWNFIYYLIVSDYYYYWTITDGTTAITRRAAASQIGEIQKYHPHELFNLLNRVCVFYSLSLFSTFFPLCLKPQVQIYPLLRSRSWETRVAAAQAIDAIAGHIPPWKGQVAGEKAIISNSLRILAYICWLWVALSSFDGFLL